MAEPLFTEPVVGYRCWEMGHVPADDVTYPLSKSTGAHMVVDANGDPVEQLPALLPVGWRSTGKPWVPGRNDAVCAQLWTTTAAVVTVDGYVLNATHVEWTHKAPDPNCGCGLYAMHTIDVALEHAAVWGVTWVLGAVLGWGALEVHDDGWRAQHACVVALAIQREVIEPGAGVRRQSVRAVAERYRAELVPYPQDLPAVAESRGKPLPASAYPYPPDTTHNGLRVINIAPHLNREVECVECGAPQWFSVSYLQTGGGCSLCAFANPSDERIRTTDTKKGGRGDE
jgi:hypothetical protein